MAQLEHLLLEGWFDKFIKWTRKPSTPAGRRGIKTVPISTERMAILKSIGSALETTESRRWIRSLSNEQLKKLKTGISKGTINSNYIKQTAAKYVKGANTAFYYRNGFGVYNNNWYKMLNGMSSIVDISNVKFSHYAGIAVSKKELMLNTLIPNFKQLYDTNKLLILKGKSFDTVGKGMHAELKTDIIGFKDKSTAVTIMNDLNRQLKQTAVGKKYPTNTVVLEVDYIRIKDKINPNYNPKKPNISGNKKWFYKDQPYYIIKLPIFDIPPVK